MTNAVHILYRPLHIAAAVSGSHCSPARVLDYALILARIVLAPSLQSVISSCTSLLL